MRDVDLHLVERVGRRGGSRFLRDSSGRSFLGLLWCSPWRPSDTCLRLSPPPADTDGRRGRSAESRIAESRLGAAPGNSKAAVANIRTGRAVIGEASQAAA